ncbi:TIGR03089 family protein [Streptomyces sp. NPDC005438]|uniref:TIGR03089 family protein n=1 Tax=Streptomyces sp. NPDC005438 TaxID=3156880 RepID=UPI0033B85CCD
MNENDRTPADLLRSALASDSARPLVTFYDDDTSERVELSVATFANWVSKTANLLQDELAVEPGERLALLLPAHWQTAVWMVAAFSAGVHVDLQGDPAQADLAVCGPADLERARACRGERVALSLRPMGARFAQPPEGFRDYAVEAPGQGDQFAPYVPVSADDPALTVEVGPARVELTGAEVVERARADAHSLGLAPGSRLLSRLPYDHWHGVSAGLLAPLAADASVVLCRNAGHLDGDALERRRDSERVTHTAE